MDTKNGAGQDVPSLDWLGEEHQPYFEDGKWRIPFLMDGAGGFGGGVGELSDKTLEGVLKLAKDKLTSSESVGNRA